MKLECRSHSDPARHPTRRFVDGRPVTMEEYWDAFDDNHSPERGMTRTMVEHDLANSQRSRVITVVLD
jgi:hypothetical protein